MPSPATRAAFLVLILGSLAYANSLGNGLVFDDQAIVARNPAVSSPGLTEAFARPYWPDQPHTGLYRPLTTLSLAVNYRLHGPTPFGYHLANLALHLLNGILVYFLANRLLRHAGAAAVTALAYVLHPVQTEAVNGAVGRSELLAAFFVLAGVLLHLRWLGGPRGQRWGSLAAAVLAGFLGCLSKENGVSLVGVLVAHDLLVGRRHRRRGFLREGIGVYALHTAAVLAYLGLRYAAIGTILLPARPLLVDNSLAHLEPWSRVLTAVAVLAVYVGRLAYPGTLSADYSYNQIPGLTSVWHWGFAAGAAVLLGLVVTVARGGDGRRPSVWRFGICFWGVTLLPFANLLFPIGTAMAERLLYLPAFGFCLLLGAGYALASRRVRQRWVAVALSAALLAAYGLRTAVRNVDWRDNLSLFASAATASPNSAKAHLNLGSALLARGDAERALGEFRRALTVYPSYAEAHYNAGVVHQKLGRSRPAMDAYELALQSDSSHVSAWVNRGILLARAGRDSEAVHSLGRATTIDPVNVEGHYNLGLVHQEEGREGPAEAAYLAALSQSPGHEGAAINLGTLYRAQGRKEEAVDLYTRVLQAKPGGGQVAYNLATDLSEMGRREQAIAAFGRAVQAGGGLGVQALRRSVDLYLARGDREAAREMLRAVLEARGADPQVQKESARLARILDRGRDR